MLGGGEAMAQVQPVVVVVPMLGNYKAFVVTPSQGLHQCPMFGFGMAPHNLQKHMMQVTDSGTCP